MAHIQNALARFSYRGKSFGQYIVEFLAGLEPLTEFDGLAPQLLVIECRDLFFESVDLNEYGLQLLDEAVIRRAE